MTVSQARISAAKISFSYRRTEEADLSSFSIGETSLSISSSTPGSTCFSWLILVPRFIGMSGARLECMQQGNAYCAAGSVVPSCEESVASAAAPAAAPAAATSGCVTAVTYWAYWAARRSASAAASPTASLG